MARASLNGLSFLLDLNKEGAASVLVRVADFSGARLSDMMNRGLGTGNFLGEFGSMSMHGGLRL